MSYGLQQVAGNASGECRRVPRRVPIRVTWPRHELNAATDETADNESTVPANDSIEAATTDSLCLKAIEELDTYRNFDKGWDGYFAPSFDPDLVLRAQNLCLVLGQFLQLDRVVPLEITPGPASDGSLDVEVVVGQREAILTLYPDQESVAIYRRRDNVEDELTSTLATGELEELFTWLVS